MKINNKKNKYFICLLILVCGIFASCGKKKEIIQTIDTIPVESNKEENHIWYYFSKDDFLQIDKPQNVPQQTPLPWTEAKRISSALAITNNDDKNYAFAIVNRLGILSFDDDKVTLSKDVNLFSDRTADNLLLLNDTPIFSVYKSAFFNNTIKNPDYKNDKSQHLFLLQFDPVTQICYPLLNCNNITNQENSEVIDFNWDGLNWICSIKTISDTKNDFSYVSWKPNTSLLNLSPGSAKENLSITEITQDEFRLSKQRTDYSKAPERIRNLLKNFDKLKSFELEIQTEGGSSPKKYTNEVTSYTDKPLKAKGILAKSWSSVLFEDGTLYIEGAIPGKHILREGKPIAIRLPKLPGSFIYSDFVISGTTLYAAWEETSFYNTARSGFLQVDLDKTLYSKIR